MGTGNNRGNNNIDNNANTNDSDQRQLDEENIESQEKENGEPDQEIEDFLADKRLSKKLHHVKPISGLYETWFLDYASYVILERAVPYVNDGLKPVQRRILHAMKRLEDGRYNKVANIIGFTMQYHPHGDTSIGEALVALGQKDLLIDTQGNWGNILTGDGAAASRYIEARLSKFALEVVFNPKTTEWKLSYDGRNKEPVQLPVKFPLLLAQGAEGIAVGLASKILPHNFNELIDASIAHLKGEPFELFPDFPTGGMADCSRYNDGLQGGKVRVRAKISKLDKRTLVITEVPFGKTTTSLIDSVISANDKGKIKIKKIDDNTAENAEILVHLPAGVSPDQTIDGLYAFTDCEVSISPNNCVIDNGKPRFMGVSEMLVVSAQNTLYLLTRELQIRKEELEEDWHRFSLEKIFIENRIYNDIEECETWESIIETIDNGLEPFKKYLRRDVTYDDIVRLTEIKIKRISRYDAFKADEHIKSIEQEIKEVDYHLKHIIEYTIDYYKRIKEKYGKARERKTELRNFDVIEATKVVAANQKLYVNRKEGFVGTGLKKDEYVDECSDIDDIIVFLKDGRYLVTKVSDKAFVGKNIIYVGIFKKNDDRTIYNVIYQDGKFGPAMIKRFAVTGVTRDREYDVTKGTPGSKVLYFTANPNGEAETVKIMLKPKRRLRKVQFDVDFSDIAIKGRSSMGNIVSKHEVWRVALKESGISTLGGRHIWFDTAVMRLNDDERGIYLGEFSGDDRIISITKSGYFQLHSFDLSTHFEPDVVLIEKYDPENVYSAVYFEGEQQFYYVKRFQVEFTEKIVRFIGDHPDSYVETVSSEGYPRVKVAFGGRKKGIEEIFDLEDFIAVKSHKARGKRLTTTKIEAITPVESPVNDEPEEEVSQEEAMDIDAHGEEISPDEGIVRDDENQAEDEKGEQRSLFPVEE
ncbi:MAG: DNA gyrase/topoisomerase IV subunit A [Candidatus Aminicenantes bacterium]|nr:DNA gyrase/topoisomerase IV subunit A [Candidatus Aminicenantes bacterium]NIM79111.1 DNA gyrase/topoisomerase IV subunit A [Candidatus Aminicenantes bacterium]NIN18396.1 DNA gyrase/topoisomerase IV subunit A [Candidatus Aminicenantes bacterium]NIN42284.1 DNA gyrase/topoisomerase IV subunit A [Candidatus Aminicenantes bacterium]NIN85050.1 DNA gyrase/topoisomerase IV subunit A [Candidatus Aminicenantes bacterium]